MRVRLLAAVSLAVLCAGTSACGGPPAPAAPESVTFIAAAEAPPQPTVDPLGASAPGPATVAPVTQPPAPQPPMSLSWSFETPPGFKGTPVTERLEVMADGTGQYSLFRGSPGEAPRDMFGPGAAGAGARAPHLPPPQTGSKRCDGHVAPELHRRVVDAARGMIGSGCDKRPAKGDVPATSVSVTYDSQGSSCPRADLSTTSWGAFDSVRGEVVRALCGSR